MKIHWVSDQSFQFPESASGIQPLRVLVPPENVLDAEGKIFEKGTFDPGEK